jgi:hypothetical protein
MGTPIQLKFLSELLEMDEATLGIYTAEIASILADHGTHWEWAMRHKCEFETGNLPNPAPQEYYDTITEKALLNLQNTQRCLLELLSLTDRRCWDAHDWTGLRSWKNKITCERIALPLGSGMYSQASTPWDHAQRIRQDTERIVLVCPPEEI